MTRILVPLAVSLVGIVVISGASGQIMDLVSTPPPAVTVKPAATRTVAAHKVLPPVILPNIADQVARLSRADRTVAVRQLAASTRVLRFWSGKHRWLLAKAHTKCSEVPWQRTCTVARASQKLHLALSVAAQEKMDATDPIIVRLNRGLLGTPMEGLGRTLRDYGRRYNVSPFFIAAAAGTESSFGFAGCGNNPKNVWGLAACDGRWSVPYFNTWDEAIGFYAKFIADRWPSATSPYSFSGYAACSACWGAKTSMWMTSRFGVSAYTKYPG